MVLLTPCQSGTKVVEQCAFIGAKARGNTVMEGRACPRLRVLGRLHAVLHFPLFPESWVRRHENEGTPVVVVAAVCEAAENTEWIQGRANLVSLMP
jgi:hypothetical protein